MLVILKNQLTDKKTLFDVQTIDSTLIMIKIGNWVKENLDTFNLCEAHSCDVTIDDKNILITGDEDRIRLSVSLAEYEAIKL